MAATLTASQEAALRAAHEIRYPFARPANGRTPEITPPSGRVPGRSPVVTPPPPQHVPGPRTLARPPAWIRAHQRLGWGLTPTARTEFQALGPDDVTRWNAMVDQQLAWEQIDDSEVETRLSNGGYTTLAKTLPQLWADHVASNPDWSVRMRPAWEVQRSIVMRAVWSKRQLRERLITFWHDHFNVRVNDYDAGPLFVHYHRNVIRGNALGNFRTMLEAVARSTSMLFYLDNRSNTRSGPNENFARELLELHTFGAENYLGFMHPGEVPPCPEEPSLPIGYTDLDVYDTAACFTGWSVNSGTGGDGTFRYIDGNHDTGPKFVLGLYILPSQPPLKDGQDVMDRICRHPRVAKFICGKLIRHFAADDGIPQALVDSAAAVFLAQRAAPDQLRQVLAHILKSEFVRESWGEKRRRPAEVTVAALRAAGADWTLRFNSRGDEFMWRLGSTGHGPCDWASPNGYPDTARAWSGANSFVTGWRMLYWLTNTDEADLRLLQIVEISRAAVPQWTARALVEFWCGRLLGQLPPGNRLQTLIGLMAQNGNPDTYVIADDNTWRGADLRGHYNHARLRTMVAMILMSPEFYLR